MPLMHRDSVLLLHCAPHFLHTGADALNTAEETGLDEASWVHL